MRAFAVYNTQTGAVVSVVTCGTRGVTVGNLPDWQAAIRVPLGTKPRGKSVIDGELTDTPPSRNSAIKKIRIERNVRLEREVDPVLNNTGRLAEMDKTKVLEWRKYRRALLDMTKQDTLNPVWPKKPTT